MKGATVFSNIDLRSWHHQLRIKEGDIQNKKKKKKLPSERGLDIMSLW
jgi:hypothetical protein